MHTHVGVDWPIAVDQSRCILKPLCVPINVICIYRLNQFVYLFVGNKHRFCQKFRHFLSIAKKKVH